MKMSRLLPRSAAAARTLLVAALLAVLLLGTTGCACCGARKAATQEKQPTPEETTLTEVGQLAPDFTVATLDGGAFTLSQQRGRVVLVNWFATWCPPCQQEMPHLRDEVWRRFAGETFTMISVAREEGDDVVRPFAEKHQAGWPFGLDLDRQAYARYAEAFIPRNTVVDRDGRIVFQSEGFDEIEFAEMIQVISDQLARP